MGVLFAALLTLAIFILFAINKNYIELIINLIIYLIIDWAIVSIFSKAPVIGVIGVSVGKPIVNILIYTIIGLISMGIFYYLSERYNFVIPIIVYVLINLVISRFYMSISGNILLDMLFNAIIGVILAFVYTKTKAMEEVKWFAIIGVVVEAILKFGISIIFFKF